MASPPASQVPVYTLGVPPSILPESYPVRMSPGPIAASISLAVITMICAIILGRKKHKPTYPFLDADTSKTAISVKHRPKEESAANGENIWGGNSTTLKDSDRHTDAYEHGVRDPGWPLPRSSSPQFSEITASEGSEFALYPRETTGRQNLNTLRTPSPTYQGRDREIPKPLFAGRRTPIFGRDSELFFFEGNSRTERDTEMEMKMRRQTNRESVLTDLSLPPQMDLGSQTEGSFVPSVIGSRYISGDPY